MRRRNLTHRELDPPDGGTKEAGPDPDTPQKRFDLAGLKPSLVPPTSANRFGVGLKTAKNGFVRGPAARIRRTFFKSESNMP